MAICYKIPKDKICSPAGKPDRPNYRPKYLENGAYELVEDGVIHSYDDIQAWSPMCDMGQIVERYIRTGDAELLQRRAGFYADVTGLPTNYVELHNMLENADRVFESLPVELREQFGNNPALFYVDGVKANEIISQYFATKKTAESVSAPVSPQSEAAASSPISPVTTEGGVLNE